MEYYLTEKSVAEYMDFVKDITSIMEKEGISPSEVPDEEFKETGNGQLECFVVIRGRRYSYFFESGEWKRDV